MFPVCVKKRAPNKWLSLIWRLIVHGPINFPKIIYYHQGHEFGFSFRFNFRIWIHPYGLLVIWSNWLRVIILDHYHSIDSFREIMDFQGRGRMKAFQMDLLRWLLICMTQFSRETTYFSFCWENNYINMMKMVKNIFPRKIKMQYWDGKIGLFYFSRHDLFCTYYFIFAGHAESTTYLYTYISFRNVQYKIFLFFLY